jgi:hypothetical protein
VNSADWFCGNSGDSNGHAVLDDDSIDLGVALQVKILVFCASRMDVCRSGIASSSGVTVDPFEPVLGAVSSSMSE